MDLQQATYIKQEETDCAPDEPGLTFPEDPLKPEVPGLPIKPDPELKLHVATSENDSYGTLAVDYQQTTYIKEEETDCPPDEPGLMFPEDPLKPEFPGLPIKPDPELKLHVASSENNSYGTLAMDHQQTTYIKEETDCAPNEPGLMFPEDPLKPEVRGLPIKPDPELKFHVATSENHSYGTLAMDHQQNTYIKEEETDCAPDEPGLMFPEDPLKAEVPGLHIKPDPELKLHDATSEKYALEYPLDTSWITDFIKEEPPLNLEAEDTANIVVASRNYASNSTRHSTESNVNTRDSCISPEIPETTDGEESESTDFLGNWKNQENKNRKQKKHKHKESNVDTEDSMASHEIPVTASVKELESSNAENNIYTQKDSLHVKQKKKKKKENKVYTGVSMVAHKIPATANEEQPQSSNEESYNMCREEGSSNVKQKKKKKKENKVNTGVSVVSHKIQVTADEEHPESSNEEIQNICREVDSLHLEWKKQKTKDRSINIGDSMPSTEVPVTANGQQPESRNEENYYLCTQKDGLHVTLQKKQKKKEIKVITGDCMESHENPAIADEQPESSTEEYKTFTKGGSSHVNQKKQKKKYRKINIEGSMPSHEIPGTANEEEPENRNQENVIVCTHKDSLHVKQKKQKIVVNKVNTEESTVSHEVTLTANGGEPKTLNQENKHMWTQKDSSHLKQRKLKNKKREVNIGDRIESNDRPLTANVELDSMNQENYLFSQKDSSYVNEKRQKNNENKVNTEGSMPLNELLVTANEQLHGSSNEEDNNMCTEEDSLHKKLSMVNTEGSMASPKILVTANGGKPESRNEENKKLTLSGEVPESHGKENKNVSTQKDISHVDHKNQKHKESEVNTGSSRMSHEIPVTVEYEESKSSNEENHQNLCTHKDSSELKRIKLKHKKKEVISFKQLLNKSPFITQSEREYTCHTCFKKFANRRNLVKHLLIHRDEEDFSCGLCALCETSFSSKPSLQEHMRTHMKEDTFVCTKCSKHFSGVDNLRRHMQRHNEVKANVEKPESRNQKNISSRISHEVPVTTKEVESKSCNENEHKVSKAIYLARLFQKSLFITQSKHEFACPKCFKNFDNRPNFVRHLLIHRDEKEFYCALCEKTFKLKQSLKVHMRTHMNEKPFECSLCSKHFSDANNLRRHMLIHNKEKEFICATCSKAFAMKHQLEKHILTHRDFELFPCPHCVKTFNYEYRLRIHLNACKKLNPITCSVCLKQVRSNYHLERHMRTHK